jgi:hypothetical protein
MSYPPRPEPADTKPKPTHPKVSWFFFFKKEQTKAAKNLCS